MKFSTFVDVFVAALYNETHLEERTRFTLGEILDRYGLTLEPSWRDMFFKDFALSSRVDVRRHLGPLRDQHVSLSADGLRWVEDEIGENVASFLEQHGAHYETENTGEERPSIPASDPAEMPSNAIFTEAGQALATEEGDFIVTGAPVSVSSEAWTGLKAVRIHAKNAQVVSGLIGNALERLSDSEAGNEAVMQAAAYLKAARELVDAPNPPSVVIWNLIEKAAVIAGLVQLFGMIFSQAMS